jgi:hypothetical protein
MWSVPPAEPPPQENGSRILAQRADEALHVAVCRGRWNGNDFVLTGESCYRRDLCHRYRRLIPEDGAEHHEAVHEERLAIAAPAVNQLCETDGACRPWYVLDLYHRGQRLPFDLALHLAGELVPATSRCRRRNDCQTG